MIDSMINSGIFGGLAAILGVALAFGSLKLFKVKDPINHKLFYVLIALGMLIAYFLREYVRTI